MNRDVLVPADSEVFHGISRSNVGRSKCGHASRDSGEVISPDEAIRRGLRPCGSCWRRKTQRQRILENHGNESDS